MQRVSIDLSRKWRSAQWVRTRLLDDEELRGRIGSRIYPVVAPSTEGSYIIVYRSGYGRERSKHEEYRNTCYVEVVVFSDEYDESLSLAELVDRILYDGMPDIKVFEEDALAILDSSEEGYTDNKFYQQLSFEIKELWHSRKHQPRLRRRRRRHLTRIGI